MNEIIEKLKKQDLSKYPKEKLAKLLNGIGDLALMITEYNSPKLLERAVPNTKEEPIFNTLSRISFKPSECNKTYQRASTPTNTMFYGSVLPEDVGEDEINYARIIGASETCELLRDTCEGLTDNKIKKGEQVITFGQWHVKKLLSLVTIVDPAKNYKIKYLQKLVSDYNIRLASEPELEKKTRDYLQYLTSEFSKPVHKDESFNYMVSAIFTEILLENHIDGILYPSVQTCEEGLCLAIHPRAMHKIELIKVLQCKVIKKDDDVKICNVAFCNVEPPNTDFVLESIC